MKDDLKTFADVLSDPDSRPVIRAIFAFGAMFGLLARLLEAAWEHHAIDRDASGAVRMTYATECSGIEAPSVAWQPLGWKPLWFSEIAVNCLRWIGRRIEMVEEPKT